jgi:uncharacterized membrane protein YccF (DUF307 family)
VRTLLDVGIPLGLGNLELAVAAIAPLGKMVVPTSHTLAAQGYVSFPRPR